MLQLNAVMDLIFFPIDNLFSVRAVEWFLNVDSMYSFIKSF